MVDASRSRALWARGYTLAVYDLGVQARYECAPDPTLENVTMTAHSISMEKSYCHFTFVPLPKQVKRVAELPNWFITLADAKTDQAVKVYMQIQHHEGSGPVHLSESQNTIDYVKVLLTDPKFIGLFGELKLNGAHMKAPNEDETYRVGKEFHNFFQRRGRNIESRIGAAVKRCTPITLAMESDAVFTTDCRNKTTSRRRGMTGEVTIFGQHHYFSLQHPLFDLSLMMTGADARKNITQELRKAFPFIQASDIKDWTFDTHVQGK